MQPTRFMPTCFFQAFWGRERVMRTGAFSCVFSVRWKRGFEAQVNFSGFCSNSLSFRWQPPADFSVHLPETTAFLASSSCCTSTGFDEKTV